MIRQDDQAVSLHDSYVGAKQQNNETRRKASLGLGIDNYNTAVALTADQKVEDIMPAQQSNISAEDIEDEEGRIREIPRQSVLSNLVESSISNFENDQSEEEMRAESDKDLNKVIANKNNIRIEKQASIGPHNNLKSRKSQKAARRNAEPAVVNLDATQSIRISQLQKSKQKFKEVDSDNKSDDSSQIDGKRGSVLASAKISQMLKRNQVNIDEEISVQEQNRNSQSRIEIRGVETIEEFFRPEFAQNTQSLDEINDDSEDEEGRQENDIQRKSRLKRSVGGNKIIPFPSFSDDNSSDDQSQFDIPKDGKKAQFRNMGFPNMNYLDPDAQGPPLQNQTYYRNYEDDQNNDVKVKREELHKAREQMPTNTFIKLFHFLNADAGDGDGTNDNGGEEGAGPYYPESGIEFQGPRANKQDELQSIQYVDQNYVESSMDTENEGAGLANFQREIGSPVGDVQIIYNPAKNKSKSLGRVGLGDQLNQFRSMQGVDRQADQINIFPQRKGSMLGDMRQDLQQNQSHSYTLAASEKVPIDTELHHQSHGRRHRIKAISSEKLPPLMSNKNIINEQGSGSRKRLEQMHTSEKGNKSRQKIYTQEPINDTKSIFLKQALGKDLIPVNFEMKGWQGGEMERRAKNLTTINVNSTYNPQQENKTLKSSSNANLRLNNNYQTQGGRSGSVNIEPVKNTISVINQGAAGNKHGVIYNHHGGGGLLSPQQATPAVDQDANLPPILKNQDNYFSRNDVKNQMGTGSTDRPANADLQASNNKQHFSMMHKRIENQNLYQGVFSGGNHKQQPLPVQNSASMKQVSNFLQSPPNIQASNWQNQQQYSQNHSPTNQGDPQSTSDRRAPIKAFPTPSNAIGNILGFNNNTFVNEAGQISPTGAHLEGEDQLQHIHGDGEAEMQEFVDGYEHAEKAHDQILCLKKIRLHHKVLAQISFNAYKFVIQHARIIKIAEGETLFQQGLQISQIYFVLYGALMVTIMNKNKQRVGDVVRGGNVLGEEAFFRPTSVYKETAVCHSAEVGVLAVDAVILSELGANTFQSKGANMMALQRDFRSLFLLFKQIYMTKEVWRERALELLSQQTAARDQANAPVTGGLLGEGFTEFRHKDRKSIKLNNNQGT